MPAPSTIVTLIDADGDEFPMRIWGHADSIGRVLGDQAVIQLQAMEAEGRMRPNWPVTVGSIEAS